MDTPYTIAGCLFAMVVTAMGCTSNHEHAPVPAGDTGIVSRGLSYAISGAGVASLHAPHPWMLHDDAGHARMAIGMDVPLPPGWARNPAAAMRAAIGGDLALDDQASLEQMFDVTSPSGFRHIRFQQYRAGFPVHGAFLSVHLHGDRISSWNASLVSIRSVRAGSLALDDSMAQGSWREACRIEHATPRVQWWVDADGNAELAYAAIAEGAGDRRVELGRLLISRVDGRVLWWEPLTRFDDAPYPWCQNDSDLDCLVATTGTGDDAAIYPLDLFRGQGFPLPYLLDGYLHPYQGDDYPDLIGDATEDDTFFVDLSQEDTLGPIYIISSDGTVFSSYDRQFFDSGDHLAYGPGPVFDAPEDGASVSSLVAVRNTLEYFWEEHGRQGIDDGQSPMDVVVRSGLSGYNASWITDYNLMCIGTSFGTSVAVAQDIIAHELTHGVIDFASHLEYSGQPGALNEALADLFGTFVEAWVTGDLNWTIGEDIPGRPPVRNLAHPERFGMPGHMSGYIGQDGGYTPLHYDSTIVNKAMYLAVEGTPPGKMYHGYAVTPIDDDPWTGLDLLARCAYDTLAYRLTPDSGFTEFALSMLGAALEQGLPADVSQRLYSSLLEAFLATGILTDAEGNPITFVSGRVVDGEDSADAPIAQAQVVLETGGKMLETTTDAAGNFKFELDDTEATSAQLTASAVGYYDLSIAVPIAFSEADTAEAGTAGVVEVALNQRPAPSLTWRLDPPSLDLPAGTTATVTLTLSNTGQADSELAFEVCPSVSYTWSEIPYTWTDLQDIVVPVQLSGDQGHSSALLLNTEFPFYLESFGQLYLSTDGYLTLSEDGTDMFRALPIPSTDAPANLIAPFWADLDFGSLDRAYFYYDSSRSEAYVQYQGVPAYATPGAYFTFQVVLLPDGRIRFYYKDIPEVPESWARVGIQDATGTEGIEVAVLQPESSPVIPRSESAIELVPTVVPSADRITFVGQDADRGNVIPGGTSRELEWAISTDGLSSGDYSLQFRVETSDPEVPLSYVPVAIHVD